MQTIERLFELKRRGSDVGKEFRGALATFLTMSYILFTNPEILRAGGIPFESAMAATALAAGICCLMMGFIANFPIALASGMGLNSIVAFQLVSATGSWQKAMGIVVLDGIVVLALVLGGFRESVMNSIPRDLKLAIGSGIGLFIAFIGLINSKLVVVPASTVAVLAKEPLAILPPVGFGNIHNPETIISIVGIVVTAVLIARRFQGAILIGIILSTLVGIPLGLTHAPHGWAAPDFSILFQADVVGVLDLAFLPLLVSLVMVDFFDTLGTVTALAEQGELVDRQGRIPRIKTILALDGISASIGGLLGASSVTSYIESSAGIAEGARTGLHTVFVGVFFLLAVFLAPLAGMVPAASTSAALILVGFLMGTQFRLIDFDELETAIPAFLVLIGIPLTFSISHGIGIGFITYCLLKLTAGKWREVSPTMYIVSAIFVLHFWWTSK